MIPATERCFQKGHFFTKLKTVSASACLLADAVDSEWGGNKIGLFFFFFNVYQNEMVLLENIIL